MTTHLWPFAAALVTNIFEASAGGKEFMKKLAPKKTGGKEQYGMATKVVTKVPGGGKSSALKLTLKNLQPITTRIVQWLLVKQ